MSIERATVLAAEYMLDEDNGKIDSSVLSRPRRPSVQECLDVSEKEMANVELDVYNMFFISDLWSQSFFYSIATLVTKMSLYIVLIIDLLVDDTYPFEQRKEGVEVENVVKAAQFFLIHTM